MNRKNILQKIDDHLLELLPNSLDEKTQIVEAAHYSLFSGGKRLRPLLTLLTTESLGCDPTISLTPACAVEMIHTYSLIHDDLPCMDDDDYRRGKPTLHKAFDEATAVLTGDFLLTAAFQIISESPILTPEQKVKMVFTLAKYSGNDGMIGGQMLDLLHHKEVEETHNKKTASLFIASVQLGAITANAGSLEFKSLIEFAHQLGLAYQIFDDIQDVTQGVEKHGIPEGSDKKNQTVTYVTAYGLVKAKEYLYLHKSNCIRILKDLNMCTHQLQEFVHELLLAK